MTGHDAAGSALVDQAQAAANHGLAFLQEVARTGGGTLAETTVTGPRAAMVESYALLTFAGRLKPCPHLTASAPQPEFWCAWKPGRLVCGPCSVALFEMAAVPPENDRCDHCGQVIPGIRACQVMMPAVVMPALRIASGPTLLAFGLCPSCYLASEKPLSLTESAERDRLRGRGRVKPRGTRGAGRGRRRR